MNNQYRKNNKRGFTLLELIIVIIIVGILASLAFVQFGNLIQLSYRAEAINTASTFMRAIDRCQHAVKDLRCFDLDALDIDNPNTYAGNHFFYELIIDDPLIPLYIVRTTRNTLHHGDGVSTMEMRVNEATDTTISCATGIFTKILPECP